MQMPFCLSQILVWTASDFISYSLLSKNNRNLHFVISNMYYMLCVHVYIIGIARCILYVEKKIAAMLKILRLLYLCSFLIEYSNTIHNVRKCERGSEICLSYLCQSNTRRTNFVEWM